MSVVPQVTLSDNQAFLQKIGILAIISANGPFSGRTAIQGIEKFKMRENRADVKVGDYAYTGSEWGKVSAIAANKITVQFAHTVKPAGVANEDHVSVRTEVYPISLNAAVAGATEDNSWQTLSSIGVVFVYPTDDIIPTVTIDNGTPVFQQGVTPVSIDFNLAGVSVQRKVNGVNVGSPIVANGSGIASVPNAATTGQLVTLVVSYNNKVVATFGPYTVLAP